MKHLIVVVVALSSFIAISEEQKKVKVKIGDLEIKKSLDGIVQSKTRIDINSKGSVKIRKILVKNGQILKVGQKLLTFDNTDEKKAYKEAKTNLEIKQLEIKNQKASLDMKKNEVKSKQMLYDEKSIAKMELTAAKNSLARAETDFKSQQIELNSLREKVQESRKDLEKSDYVSPINGVVSGVILLKVGQIEVAGGTKLMTISDPKNFVIKVQVSDVNTHKISIGKKTNVVLDVAKKDPLQGVVQKMDYISENKRSIVRQFQLTVKLPHRGYVREGQAGKVNFVFDKKKNVLLIPRAAISYIGGESYVMSLDSDSTTPVKTKITIGLQSSLETEVLSGLKENNLVVIKEQQNN